MERQSLAAAFVEALSAYLANPDETARARAYELGRTALTDGLGVLALVSMYHDAMRLIAGSEGHTSDTVARAADFLGESLAPFEMTLHGYKEANEQLRALTRTLEQQNCELRAATAATGAANKELEAFSYSVSHDLRAPVRHIAGFSQLLMDQYAAELHPTALRYVTIIRNGAERMTEMIEDLLNLSRIDRQSLARRPVDLGAVVSEVIRELQPNLSGRTIDWRLERLPVEQCDPGLIKLALANLISNAVKYSRNRERPTIHIGQALENGARVIFVRDNGAGFDQKYAGKLFGVFQRLHQQDEFEGTGIGLATVERIIRKHAGRIWAEAALDKGATFFFTLGA